MNGRHSKYMWGAGPVGEKTSATGSQQRPQQQQQPGATTSTPQQRQTTFGYIAPEMRHNAPQSRNNHSPLSSSLPAGNNLGGATQQRRLSGHTSPDIPNAAGQLAATRIQSGGAGITARSQFIAPQTRQTQLSQTSASKETAVMSGGSTQAQKPSGYFAPEMRQSNAPTSGQQQQVADAARDIIATIRQPTGVAGRQSIASIVISDQNAKPGINVATTDKTQTLSIATATTPTQGGFYMQPLVMRHPKITTDANIVLIFRAAERIDRIFPEWLRLCYNDSGRYSPFDGNMPMQMIKRKGGPLDYIDDLPITEVGMITAQLIGRGLKMHHLYPKAIYCSPSLRCVQTAAALLAAVSTPSLSNPGVPLAIRVEPALFEWAKWYKRLPQLLTVAELIKLGYNIDGDYKPMMRVDDLSHLCGRESVDAYHKRTKATMNHLMRKSTAPVGVTIIIAHGSTIDAGARGLCGKDQHPMREDDIYHMGIHYPYMANVALSRPIVRQQSTMPGDKSAADDSEWRFVHDLMPPLNYVSLTTRPDALFLNR